MTVAELIAELQKYPAEIPVVFCVDGVLWPVLDIEEYPAQTLHGNELEYASGQPCLCINGERV